MMTSEGRKSPVHVHVDRETPVHVHLKKRKKGKAGVPTAVEVSITLCEDCLYTQYTQNYDDCPADGLMDTALHGLDLNFILF